MRITVEMGEPVAVEKDGMLARESNEKTHVEITDEQVKDIIKNIKEAREFMVE